MSQGSGRQALLSAARTVWPFVAMASAMRLAVGASYVAQAFLVAKVLGSLLRGGGVADNRETLVALAGIVALRFALVWTTERLGERTSAATKERLRVAAFTKLAELGPAFLGGERTGEIQSTLVSGVESLETYFGRYLPAYVSAFIAPAAIVVLLSRYDLTLALTIALFAVALAIVPRIFHARLGKAAEARMDEYLGLGADFLDSVQGIVTLKALGASSRRRRMLDMKSNAVATQGIRELAVVLSQQGIATMLLVGGGAAAVVLASVRVAREELALGTLFLALFLAREALRPFGELSAAFHASFDATSAAGRLATLHATEPAVAEPKEPASFAAGASANIVFDGVSFRYSADEPLVLDDVSLEVSPGETVAIVGPSGAGKSTLAALLLRFLQPDRGRVVAFERDLRRVTTRDLRSKIAVVSQDTYLFAGSVLDNLRMARPRASREEIETAARDADAHDFIMELPRGYETPLGERGQRLSGGQRQRLALARALLKNAPVLVLDEATSSLDAASEERVAAALARAAHKRTTIVIAHRLSTIRSADRIVVLEGGRVVETGTHDDLARASGTYARLIAAQEAS